MAPAPRARSNRLLSPNRINDARMSRLVPRANRGGVPWGGWGVRRPTRGPTCGPACGPARGSTCKPIRGPTRGSNPEKLPLRKAHELRLANFSLYSADAVPSANMDATEKTPFVGAERPLAGDAPGARRPQTCQPRARGSRTYQLAQPRRGHSRQREFSVAFGEKARDRWAARPG